MVVAIAAMLIVPMYWILLSTINMGPVQDRMEQIRFGIGEYYRIFGRLPCPAALDAAPGDALYSTGNLSGGACTGVIDAGDAWIGALPTQDLAAAMDCMSGDNPAVAGSRAAFIAALPADLQGIFQRDLHRTQDVRRSEALGGSTADKTAYKKEECVNDDLLLDGHENKFVYAVTKGAVSISSFDPADPAAGRIQIVDVNDNPLTADGQWFLLLSHGEDGKGAYSSEGHYLGGCGTDAAVKDNENCNFDDAVFRAMPFSSSADANHFDDFVDFSLDSALGEHSPWYWRADADTTASRDMRFQPQGRMVIDAPEGQALDPNDLMYVGQGSVRVQQDAGGTGGNLMAPNGVVRAARDVTSDTDVLAPEVNSPKYCYTGSTTPGC